MKNCMVLDLRIYEIHGVYVSVRDNISAVQTFDLMTAQLTNHVLEKGLKYLGNSTFVCIYI